MKWTFLVVLAASATLGCSTAESSSSADQVSAGGLRSTPSLPGPAPVGACCLPDTSCSQLTESACVIQSGAWAGADSQCEGRECVPPCPIVACCTNTGQCEMAQASECVAAGGYADGATSCESVTCAPPDPTVACCWPGVGCQEDSRRACNALGAIAHEGKTCSEVTCPTGTAWACCVKGECVSTDAEGCQQAEGTWLAGLMCGDHWSCEKPPAIGACCFEGGCFQSMQADCDPAIGTFVVGGDCELNACKGEG